MKRREVRFAVGADDDLVRLFEFLAASDIQTARRALRAIRNALKMAAAFPYSCRKASSERWLRECVVTFGRAGYVAAFSIEDDHILVLAVRHQREDDFE